MANNNPAPVSDLEWLESLGIKPMSPPSIPIEQSYQGKVKSENIAGWLADKLSGMGAGAMVGGGLGGAAGVGLMPFAGPAAPAMPYIGATGGAMAGQGIEDILRSGDIDPYQMIISGLTGAAGPAVGKMGTGIGSLLTGATRITPTMPSHVTDKIASLLMKLGLGGAGAWGSYHMSGGHPIAAALGGLLLPAATQFGRGMYHMGTMNPYVTGLATGGLEALKGQLYQQGGQPSPTPADIEEIRNILGGL